MSLSSLRAAKRIARNASENDVDHKVVFGFSYQSAPTLVEFLKRHRNDLRHVTGVRYSGELGHPFHVIDDEAVVLPLDHPFVKEGHFASLLVRDRDLARNKAICEKSTRTHGGRRVRDGVLVSKAAETQAAS